MGLNDQILAEHHRLHSSPVLTRPRQGYTTGVLSTKNTIVTSAVAVYQQLFQHHRPTQHEPIFKLLQQNHLIRPKLPMNWSLKSSIVCVTKDLICLIHLFHRRLLLSNKINKWIKIHQWPTSLQWATYSLMILNTPYIQHQQILTKALNMYQSTSWNSPFFYILPSVLVSCFNDSPLHTGWWSPKAFERWTNALLFFGLFVGFFIRHPAGV